MWVFLKEWPVHVYAPVMTHASDGVWSAVSNDLRLLSTLLVWGNIFGLQNKSNTKLEPERSSTNTGQQYTRQ